MKKLTTLLMALVLGLTVVFFQTGETSQQSSQIDRIQLVADLADKPSTDIKDVKEDVKGIPIKDIQEDGEVDDDEGPVGGSSGTLEN